jgi:hypothetical protein
MISARDLRRCIDILAELNASANSDYKRLILEVGYILKQELEAVEAWDSQFKDKKRGYGNIDVNKLLEDNTQLFNENKQLQDLNLKLKEVIDQRIPNVERGISEVNRKFNIMSETINKL